MIGIVVFFIGTFLPDFNMVLINIAYKPIVLVIIYYGLIKIFGLKADIIDLGESIVYKMTGIKLG